MPLKLCVVGSVAKHGRARGFRTKPNPSLNLADLPSEAIVLAARVVVFGNVLLGVDTCCVHLPGRGLVPGSPSFARKAVGSVLFGLSPCRCRRYMDVAERDTGESTVVGRHLVVWHPVAADQEVVLGRAS